MRNVLVGAVETSRVALEMLGRRGFPPQAVFTLPADRAHRHSDWADLRPLAAQLAVPVVEAADVNAPDVLAAVREYRPDYVFVIGWSQICRSEFLRVPALGSIGYHPAPLPENRGRAVIPWTILQRRADTGATLFWMDEGMDSGDILVQERFPVAPDETARTLYDKHLVVLESMLSKAIEALRGGDPPRIAQDARQATYCARRTAADGMIEWGSTADAVLTLVRAVGDPYPGAFSFYRGRKLTVWEAEHHGRGPYWGLPGQVQAIAGSDALVQCGDREHVLLHTVELEGAGRCAAADVLRVHERLGPDWAQLLARWRTAP